MKRIETNDVIYEIKDGILFCSYKENLVLDVTVARRIVSDRLLFTEGQEYLILIDFNNLKSANKEAREYMNAFDGGLKGLIGGAFVSDKIAVSVFINLYLKIDKPKIPTKFFSQHNEALTWLKSLTTV
ncbi:MAG: hypothetical protein Q7W45_07940 [Bacteroidota bacterium]|nr:hypothetical protein [Bacteroidota bacterium]MDP3145975.1 hypothetical protein [Bacteroidota bacterium]